jgi:membrane-bound metal-dependent hydrolase YbcI (DUF457 family)
MNKWEHTTFAFLVALGYNLAWNWRISGLIGTLACILLAMAPDVDQQIPFLKHRGWITHSLLVPGGLCAAFFSYATYFNYVAVAAVPYARFLHNLVTAILVNALLAVAAHLLLDCVVQDFWKKEGFLTPQWKKFLPQAIGGLVLAAWLYSRFLV